MASKGKKDQVKEEEIKATAVREERMFQSLPPELQAKYKPMREKAHDFSTALQEKFGEYVVGVCLMPPEQKKDEVTGQPVPVDPNTQTIMVVMDDSDSKRFPREDLQVKFQPVIEEIAKGIDANIKAEVLLLSLLWQSCLDAKYDIVRGIGMGLPVYDTGALAAVKLSEMHKNMTLGKFERYIVSYVLAGSIIRGEATATSDIDVWLVIDDTDVKKITRYELKDKLRSIIHQMGVEAGEALGIRSKLNMQVYILSEFWDALKEANPVIFTLLRDGVPFFDRGMFMPWKQLLRMGKIRPSNEAINLFMNSGQEAIKRTKMKLREMGMEDMYYAMLTPTQSALMMHGVPPTSPKETPGLFRDIFVKKEKLVDEKYAKMLEKVIQVRKDLEHGTLKSMSGKEIDELLKNAEDYLKKIESVFEHLHKQKEEDDIATIHKTAVELSIEALGLVGEKATEKNILESFKEHLVVSNLIAHAHLRTLQGIVDAKEAFDKGNLTQDALAKARKEFAYLSKGLHEFIDRKKRVDLQRAKIRVKHGETFGELILLKDKAFIIDDVGQEQPTIRKAEIDKKGKLVKLEASSFDELEEVLTKEKIPKEVFVTQPIFEDLEKAFGKGVEIVL